MSNSIRQLNKIFVGNLPWTVSHNELKKFFSEYGQIMNASVMFDKNTGLSKGFGFVTFQNKEAVDKVFSTDSHVLEGSRLSIQPSDSHNRSDRF
jgi:RNA-binding proteins (RRM domain)